MSFCVSGEAAHFSTGATLPSNPGRLWPVGQTPRKKISQRGPFIFPSEKQTIPASLQIRLRVNKITTTTKNPKTIVSVQQKPACPEPLAFQSPHPGSYCRTLGDLTQADSLGLEGCQEGGGRGLLGLWAAGFQTRALLPRGGGACGGTACAASVDATAREGPALLLEDAIPPAPVGGPLPPHTFHFLAALPARETHGA